jgi:hypothetical protein
MRKLVLILAVLTGCLLSVSCGNSSISSSGSGGSGIGGTGISLVKGNIASVDGQLVLYIRADDFQIVYRILELVSTTGYTQNAKVLSVSGGGVSSPVNNNGQFELSNVSPSENFKLVFLLSTKQAASLSIGRVGKDDIVIVNDISINSDAGTASAKTIDVTEFEEDENSEDDVSEDNEFEEFEEDENSEDNISEDDEEDDISEDNSSEK